MASGEQLSLPLNAPRQRPKRPAKHKLFFAVLPDDEAKGRIAALMANLQADDRLRGSLIASERLHVSLFGLDGSDSPSPNVIAAARGVGAAIDAPSFQVAFDRVLSFKVWGGYALVLTGGDGLTAMRVFERVVGREMERVGFKRGQWSGFRPHVTLLYGDYEVPEMRIDPVTWTVRELVLIESIHGQGRHIHLDRWPLRR